MGAQQAAQVLVTVKEQQRRRDQGTLSDDERRKLSESILQQYEDQGSPYYSTARLWDDGILDPVDTRRVIGLCLDLAALAPVGQSRAPVFRM